MKTKDEVFYEVEAQRQEAVLVSSDSGFNDQIRIRGPVSGEFYRFDRWRISLHFGEIKNIIWEIEKRLNFP